MSSFDKCYYCGAEMTGEEVSRWIKETPVCCNGFECGCMGLPTEPPICDKCIREFEAIECDRIERKIIDAGLVLSMGLKKEKTSVYIFKKNLFKQNSIVYLFSTSEPSKLKALKNVEEWFDGQKDGDKVE